MSLNCKPVVEHVFRKCGCAFLVLAILSGFTFGIYTASISTFPFISLMCGFDWNTVSIVRVLCAVLLPLFLAVFAVMLSKPGILYCLVFARAFIRSFILYGIVVTFGHAAWFVSALNLTVPSLVDCTVSVIALRHVSERQQTQNFCVTV